MSLNLSDRIMLAQHAQRSVPRMSFDDYFREQHGPAYSPDTPEPAPTSTHRSPVRAAILLLIPAAVLLIVGAIELGRAIVGWVFG